MSDAPELLDPASAAEADLSPEAIRSYQLYLESDQFAHLSVEQRGVDVKVSVFGPEGDKLHDFDSRWVGTEPVFILSQQAGLYSLNLQSRVKASGKCSLSIKEICYKRTGDYLWLQAACLASDAKQLVHEGSFDSFQAAMQKYRTVLSMWQQLGALDGE